MSENDVVRLPEVVVFAGPNGSDLREYLTNYQEEKKSSRVTIDNIRRILSSFLLGWRMRIIY